MDFNKDNDSRMDSFLAMLTFVRSHFIVGAALAARFPTPEAWEEALNSGELLEALNDFNGVVEEISRVSSEELDFPDLEAITSLSEEHYEQAKETVENLAESLQIPADDLIVVLMES